MMKRMALTTPLILAACAPSPAPGRPTVVPIEREPSHHVVFESSLVRIFDVRLEPGDTTMFHVHADPHAGVLISGSARWGQTLGEAGTVESGDTVGTLLDNATSPLPYTHRVANVDSTPFRYVMGQFLAHSTIASAPLPEEPGVTLERETSRARMYRIRLLPGQATSRHRHAQPGLLIQIGNGTVEWMGDRPEASSGQSGAGAWWWRAAGNAHSIRNAGADPVELIEIDWK
jgi:quercetin dioxygenase-like cupin family protein